jgi:hypothetical protein
MGYRQKAMSQLSIIFCHGYFYSRDVKIKQRLCASFIVPMGRLFKSFLVLPLPLSLFLSLTPSNAISVKRRQTVLARISIIRLPEILGGEQNLANTKISYYFPYHNMAVLARLKFALKCNFFSLKEKILKDL